MIDYNGRYCTLTDEGMVLLNKFKEETGTTGNIQNVIYDGSQFVELSFVGSNRRFFINALYIHYMVD